MSQINHYQDESDYALKRIDGKMYNTLQINFHTLRSFLIICIMFSNQPYLDNSNAIIFMLNLILIYYLYEMCF